MTVFYFFLFSFDLSSSVSTSYRFVKFGWTCASCCPVQLGLETLQFAPMLEFRVSSHQINDVDCCNSEFLLMCCCCKAREDRMYGWTEGKGNPEICGVSRSSSSS